VIELTIRIQSVGDMIRLRTASNMTARNLHMKTTGELMALATFCQKLDEGYAAIMKIREGNSEFHQLSQLAAKAAKDRVLEEQ